MKISPNSKCPCGSGKKYKKCCQIFHKGAIAKDALSLMKSRYSAYAVGDAEYIIKTTAKENKDYMDNKAKWKEEIKAFHKNNIFEKLKIVEYIEDSNSATVEFEAYISGEVMREKSHFIKQDNKWLYLDGEIK